MFRFTGKITERMVPRSYPKQGTKLLIFSLLAQLVERVTVNHFVVGSSPAQGAKMSRSSSGPGPRPFTAVTGVRVSYGMPTK